MVAAEEAERVVCDENATECPNDILDQLNATLDELDDHLSVTLDLWIWAHLEDMEMVTATSTNSEFLNDF